MRGAIWGTMAKACLFAIVWHVAIWFIPRREDLPVVTISLAFASAFFPIIVAVNMGYNAASRERQRLDDEKKTRIEAATYQAVTEPEDASKRPASDAITTDVEASRRGIMKDAGRLSGGCSDQT